MDFVAVIINQKSKIKYLKIKFLNKSIISKQTPIGRTMFFCPNEICYQRAASLLSKEPETIEWINEFNTDDTIWDIGANVGCYSIYSALKGHKVLAFEPSAGNYYILNRNIELNEMQQRVSSFCLAFSDKTKLGYLNMPTYELGAALNNFGEQQNEHYVVGKRWNMLFKQRMIGFTIDDFIQLFELRVPNHIKIDVDGIEDKILSGASKTLKNPNLKSILVELDMSKIDSCKQIIKTIEDAGLRMSPHKHQRFKVLQEGNVVCNYIFLRS